MNQPLPFQAATEPPLRIRALGNLEISLNGKRRDQWPRRKVPVLLMALALKPEGYDKEELAGLLFPDLGPAEAEHHLGNLNYPLRKLLEPTLKPKASSAFIEVQGGRYRLKPGTYETDFDEFLRRLKVLEARRRQGETAVWKSELQILAPRRTR